MARKRAGETRAQPPEDGPRCMCAMMGCDERAILKVRVSTTAWSNFCYRHYLARSRATGEARCSELGLTTTAQQRAWVKEQATKLSAHFTPDYQREPGED